MTACTTAYSSSNNKNNKNIKNNKKNKMAAPHTLVPIYACMHVC